MHLKSKYQRAYPIYPKKLKISVAKHSLWLGEKKKGKSRGKKKN